MKPTTHGGARKNAGRKPKYANPCLNIGLKLPDFTVAKIDRLRAGGKISRADIVVEAVEFYRMGR